MNQDESAQTIMPKVNFREEVLNVVLAELLEQRGMLSVPETIRKSIVRRCSIALRE